MLTFQESRRCHFRGIFRYGSGVCGKTVPEPVLIASGRNRLVFNGVKCRYLFVDETGFYVARRILTIVDKNALFFTMVKLLLYLFQTVYCQSSDEQNLIAG